ncbi:hypothetical protein [Caulobacter rhizosphaerae]|jgi:hypothetical protein|uniref:hypothetical protein n=1 Tax=Caulobacter rhizosphaerae TaxID=2010972 RepID=UPI0013D22513|nr:hypothetical protein [Caulobacter rhizosphaerae]
MDVAETTAHHPDTRAPMQRSVAAKCVGNLSDAAGKSPKHRQCSAFDTVTEAVSWGFFSKVNLAWGVLTARSSLRPALAAARPSRVEFAFQPNRIRGMRPALSASLWKI